MTKTETLWTCLNKTIWLSLPRTSSKLLRSLFILYILFLDCTTHDASLNESSETVYPLMHTVIKQWPAKLVPNVKSDSINHPCKQQLRQWLTSPICNVKRDSLNYSYKQQIRQLSTSPKSKVKRPPAIDRAGHNNPIVAKNTKFATLKTTNIVVTFQLP